MITVTSEVELYLNCSPQWICFFEYSRNLETSFLKNTSDKYEFFWFKIIILLFLEKLPKETQIFQIHFPISIFDLELNVFF